MKDFLDNSDRVRFTLAVCIFVPALVYMFMASFCDIPAENQRTVDNSIGFIMGTLMSAIVSYFFGSSQGSADKDKATKPPVE
jgi:hypothetical protein